MSDNITRAVLAKFQAAHELHCGARVLMFNWDFDTNNVTIRASSSKEHVVRFDEIRLCDYLNSLAMPVTETLVIETLCDIYDRPGHYGIAKLSD